MMATTTTMFRPSSTRPLAGRFSTSCSCSSSSISASTVSCSRTIIAARSRLSLSSSLNRWRAFSTSTFVPGPGDFSRAVRRQFSSSPVVWHGDIERPEPGTGLKITFRESNGDIIRTVEANEGDDILSIAHEYDIDLEGACEGSVACSTCHVILPEEFYDRIEEPTDEENDMLDLAFGLTDTSRLGCQVKMEKAIDGITVTLPSATRNMFVDGAKPTKH